MFIQTITFTTAQENQEKLHHKIKKDFSSLTNWETCQSVEVWSNENQDSITYTLVSKWATKQDFRTWLAREEHRIHHRNMAKESQSKPIFQKAAKEYLLVSFGE